MMGKQSAGNEVEAGVAEGKSESVADDRPATAVQVRTRTVKQRDVEMHAGVVQLSPGNLRHIARSGGNLKQGKGRSASCCRYSFDHRRRCGYASEPPVHASQISQGSGDFCRRTGVGVEPLGDGYSLHRAEARLAQNSDANQTSASSSSNNCLL